MARRLIDKKNERRYDDCLKYTMVGSKKALKAAGLDPQVLLGIVWSGSQARYGLA